jgi:hypothetical protein
MMTSPKLVDRLWSPPSVIQRTQGFVLGEGVKWLEREPDHLMPRLRMSGAIFLSPNIHLWYEQGFIIIIITIGLKLLLSIKDSV